jgi:hypothetical protein
MILVIRPFNHSGLSIPTRRGSIGNTAQRSPRSLGSGRTTRSKHDRGTARRRAQRSDGMLPARPDRRANFRGPTRKPRPSQQALPHLRHAPRSAQPPPREGAAEAFTCTPAVKQWWGAVETRGRGSREIRGSTPCKANCPCTAAGGVERGLGGGAGHSPAMPNGRCRQSASLGRRLGSLGACRRTSLLWPRRCSPALTR